MPGTRMIKAICIIAVVCCLAAGCRTVRYVETGDMEVQEMAPEWARTNGMVDPSSKCVYFVGISEEQSRSESEAVREAYHDALCRVADAIQFEMDSRETLRQGASAGMAAKWPYETGEHVKAHLFGFGGAGLGAFALTNGLSDAGLGLLPLGFGVITPGRTKWSHAGQADYAMARRSQILRRLVAGMATIEDTWTTRERFQTKPSLNQMKYGAVWKAKVLVSIPKNELEDRAETEFNVRRTEVALATAELEREISQLELATARDEATQELAIKKDVDWHELAIDEGRKKLEGTVISRPTFNFMTNTCWHGYLPTNRIVVESRAANPSELVPTP